MDATRRRDLHEDLRPIQRAAARASACVAIAASLAFLAAGVKAAPASGAGPTGMGPIPGMAPNLTGPMASWRYMLGSWSCSSAQKPNGFPLGFFVTAAPGNTMQTAFRSPAVSGAGFFGYDTKSKVYWSAYTDNTGTRYYETSRDGVTFVGTMTTAQSVVALRSTTTKISDTKILTVTEERTHGTWTKSGDNTCTKS